MYNTCFVRWQTHTPPGLSGKDVAMAEICDGLASREESQEIWEGKHELDKDTAGKSGLEGAADMAVKAADGCCGPMHSTERNEDERKV